MKLIIFTVNLLQYDLQYNIIKSNQCIIEPLCGSLWSLKTSHNSSWPAIVINKSHTNHSRHQPNAESATHTATHPRSPVISRPSSRLSSCGIPKSRIVPHCPIGAPSSHVDNFLTSATMRLPQQRDRNAIQHRAHTTTRGIQARRYTLR